MKIKLPLLGALAISLLSSQAYADSRGHHDNGWRGHDRHDYHHREYHHPRTPISLNFGNAGWYRPYPPAPYYQQTRVIYAQPVIVPPPVQVVDNDRYCREYQTTSRVGGRLQPSYGTACYQPDGSWQIVAD